MTLGHGKGVLNAVSAHNADKVDWNSSSAHSGGLLGAVADLPFAIWAPSAFGYAALASTGYNIAFKCELGGGCSTGEWILMLLDAGAGGAAGLSSEIAPATLSLIISELRLEFNDSTGDPSIGLASARHCALGSAS